MGLVVPCRCDGQRQWLNTRARACNHSIVELSVLLRPGMRFIHNDQLRVQSIIGPVRSNSLHVPTVVGKRHHLVCYGAASLQYRTLLTHPETLCENDLLSLLSFRRGHDYLRLAFWFASLGVDVARGDKHCDASRNRRLALLSPHRPIHPAEPATLAVIALPAKDVCNRERLPVFERERIASMFTDRVPQSCWEEGEYCPCLVCIKGVRKVLVPYTIQVAEVSLNS